EPVRLRPVAADGVLHHLREIDLAVVDAEVGAVHPGEVEEILDEPLEPPRLGGDRRSRLARVDDSVLDRLRVATNRGERRLQLVADREEEVPLRLLRTLQLL